MKRPDGLKVIIIYFFVTAGLALLGAFYSFLFGVKEAGLLARLCGMLRWLSPPIALATLVSSGLLYALVATAVGLGLLAYHPWGRWGAIVLAALTLFNFPLGTVIGVAIIIYLLQPRVRALFKISAW
jgi:hypothetical protein